MVMEIPSVMTKEPDVAVSVEEVVVEHVLKVCRTCRRIKRPGMKVWEPKEPVESVSSSTDPSRAAYFQALISFDQAEQVDCPVCMEKRKNAKALKLLF